MSERDRFEEWARDFMLVDVSRRPDGRYVQRETSDLWQAWAAGAAERFNYRAEIEARVARLESELLRYIVWVKEWAEGDSGGSNAGVRHSLDGTLVLLSQSPGQTLAEIWAGMEDV